MSSENGMSDLTALSVPKYTAASVVVAAIAGIVGAWILSFAYGPICHYNPIIYIGFLIAGAMGFLVGAISRAMMRRFRIDGLSAATVIGAIAGFFTVWFCWLAYLWVLFDYDFSEYAYFLIRPYSLLQVMTFLAENPQWTINRGLTPGSWFYYLCWLGEFLLIVGASILTTRGFVMENRLCNNCGDWLAVSDDRALFQDPGPESDPVVVAGDFEPLLASPRHNGDETVPGQWIEARGFACSNCPDEDQYVNVYRVVMKPEKDGKKLTKAETKVAAFVRVDPETERRLFDPPKEDPVAGSTDSVAPIEGVTPVSADQS